MRLPGVSAEADAAGAVQDWVTKCPGAKAAGARRGRKGRISPCRLMIASVRVGSMRVIFFSPPSYLPRPDFHPDVNRSIFYCRSIGAYSRAPTSGAGHAREPRNSPVPGKFWGPCRHCECISDYRADGRRNDCRAVPEYLARVLLGRIRLVVNFGPT